ncbi:hypothetical protein CgunFtcFv8_000236 [Champsocephalus gunnari]|uniref:Uncharacterized protein n=1 Tax=Champsocephalus gunnari TaxID=52237 RepID=A0AAN8DS52_CHAGU|nr:hypothetical protein CgunFtcFv8_000236 [Champsocephalus gunnari]
MFGTSAVLSTPSTGGGEPDRQGRLGRPCFGPYPVVVPSVEAPPRTEANRIFTRSHSLFLLKLNRMEITVSVQPAAACALTPTNLVT